MLYTIRKPTELENDDWSERQALCLGDEELHWDGGEPEDQYYFRKWGWVPGLLNKERSRWIELQNELHNFLDEKLNEDVIDRDLFHEMKRLFCNRFDEGKE